MAYVASYFEDNNEKMYQGGPYVLVAGPMGQGYRIEKRGETGPVLPPLWIYYLRELRGIPQDGWQPREVLEPIVDDLNALHRAVTIS